MKRIVKITGNRNYIRYLRNFWNVYEVVPFGDHKRFVVKMERQFGSSLRKMGVIGR